MKIVFLGDDIQKISASGGKKHAFGASENRSPPPHTHTHTDVYCPRTGTTYFIGGTPLYYELILVNTG